MEGTECKIQESKRELLLHELLVPRCQRKLNDELKEAKQGGSGDNSCTENNTHKKTEDK